MLFKKGMLIFLFLIPLAIANSIPIVEVNNVFNKSRGEITNFTTQQICLAGDCQTTWGSSSSSGGGMDYTNIVMRNISSNNITSIDSVMTFNGNNSILASATNPSGGIRFVQTRPEAKDGIWWRAYDHATNSNTEVGWIVCHYNSTNGNVHSHCSWETLDNSTGTPSINSHFTIDYNGSQNLTKVQFPSSWVSQMRVDDIFSLYNDNIDFKADTAIRAYPSKQTTLALSINNNTDNITITGLGTNNIEFLDNGYFNGKNVTASNFFGSTATLTGQVAGNYFKGSQLVDSGGSSIIDARNPTILFGNGGNFKAIALYGNVSINSVLNYGYKLYVNGSSKINGDFIVNGGVNASTSVTTPLVSRDMSDNLLVLAGGATILDGAQLVLYGSTHAIYPNQGTFYYGATRVGGWSPSYFDLYQAEFFTDKSMTIKTSTTSYGNDGGAIYINNTDVNGNDALIMTVNDVITSKWRSDYAGDISWCAGGIQANQYFQTCVGCASPDYPSAVTNIFLQGSTGYVGVGNPSGAPYHQLDVQTGDISTLTGNYIWQENTGVTDTYDDGVDTTIYFGGGIAYAIGTNFDNKLMTNITNLTTNNKIGSLTPITFQWNEQGIAQYPNQTKQNKTYIGFSAQEVAKYYPQCIINQTEPDKFTTTYKENVIPISQAYDLITKNETIIKNVLLYRYDLENEKVISYNINRTEFTDKTYIIKQLKQNVRFDDKTGQFIQRIEIKQKVFNGGEYTTYNRDCLNIMLWSAINKLCTRNPTLCQ